MKSSSKSSFLEVAGRQSAAGRGQPRRHRWLILPTAYCLLLAGITGCESLQRKFTRKPKHPKERPNPVISFQDYTSALTPMDRYRKHFLMFEYWNGELIDALARSPVNPKRIRRASSEALAELEQMQGILNEESSVRLAPHIATRKQIDAVVQDASFYESQANALWQELNAQTRQIHREFYWRQVEDQLHETAGGS